MQLPDDIRCKCGDTVTTSVVSGLWSCKCSQCGRSAGPKESTMSLYAEWYNLIPVRKAADDIGRAMASVIMKLSEKGVYTNAKELVSTVGDEAIARRAIEILHDTGLISARYICDDKEISFKEAIEMKKDGKKLEVSFVKTFSRN